MIIKSFELEKIISLNFNIHLIYGNNEGIKQDIISNLYKKNYEGEVLKYDEQDILTNKDEFISTAEFMIKKRKEPLSVPNEVLIYLMTQKVKEKNYNFRQMHIMTEYGN